MNVKTFKQDNQLTVTVSMFASERFYWFEVKIIMWSKGREFDKGWNVKGNFQGNVLFYFHDKNDFT